MGCRENLADLPSGSQSVLSSVMSTIDELDLYGHVAYPKRHAQEDVGDLYRFAYSTRGCFANVALQVSSSLSSGLSLSSPSPSFLIPSIPASS